MSLPPPSDPYGPGPSGSPPSGPPPGHPYGSSPQWGPSPPMPVPGQPPHVPGGPQWGHPAQSGWPPPPPQRRGSGIKWLLLAVALLLVIAISVGATLLFTRDGGGGNPPTASPPTSGPTSEIASADDTGPVAIITEDPTCDAWRPIVKTLSDREGNGWDTRDPSIPASAWTPEQKAQYRAVGNAMRDAADQIVPLARTTPHRVMRELYSQMIAYLREYSDRIPDYQPADDYSAIYTNTSAAALNAICSAISYKSAAARARLVEPVDPPADPPLVNDLNDPVPFLLNRDPAICAEWISATEQFNADTIEWQGVDPGISASQWTDSQRSVNEAVAPIMLAFADKIQVLGTRSNNPIWQDFATLSAQYRRAYAASIPTYIPVDNYLADSAAHLMFMVNAACKAE